MKVSRTWLNQFVSLADVSDEQFSALFNIRTAELEGIENLSAQWQHIVVGEILSIAAHPNATKLQVTQTNIGDRTVQIVCGASNIRVGMKVIVALPGSKVRWHGEGDLVELKETELRGVTSVGMICGADEVGLPNTEDGVKDLSALPAKVGTPLAQALGLDDSIVEIDNKSLTHRPDLWGHYGLARECAVIWDRKLLPLPVDTSPAGTEQLAVQVSASTLCTRYMAVKLQVTDIRDHTELANRLRALGHSSHGLIVDTTNYIMQELGQPLHAFDATQVVGAIHVRHAVAGETIETLDGVVRTLDSTMLVIADDQKVLAIAGVMGGKSSQITESTTSIILEAAHFDPTSVRVTAHKLGLRTDAVQRYEKSLDPYLPETALRRFLLILGQYCTVKISSEIVDQFPLPPQPKYCVINPQRINARIGTDISTGFISHTLEQLGFVIKKTSEQEWQLTIPSYRATKDVSSEVDIIEEIARFYGYEKITPILPRVPLGLPIPQPWYELEKKVKTFLAFTAGLQEVSKHSFYSEATIKQFGLDQQHTVLRNSLSQDHTHLRVSLLPGLCDVVQRNSTTKLPINIFEIGKTFLPSSKDLKVLPTENVMIGIVVSDPENNIPFKKVQATVSKLLGHLHLEVSIEPWSEGLPIAAQAGRAATIKVANQVIGHIFEVAGVVRSRLKLEQRVAYAEINFEQLLNTTPNKALEYEPVPKFPHKVFDVSVVVDRQVAAGTLLHELQKLDPLISVVQLFDIYEGDKIATTNKALAYQFTLQSQDRTLTDEDMHRVQKVVFDFLTTQYQGVIRGL